MNKFIISIDGPAGSGKEKIAKYISKKYNLFHLDSGLLYRRFAYIILKKNTPYNNQNSLKKLIKSINYISSKNHKTLRNEKVGLATSKIATIPLVREFINDQQRKIINKELKSNRGCVVDGRDIGSKVFKDAKIKLFIQVKAEIRAKRRHKQLLESGEKSIYAQILKEINLRDSTDINRKDSPLIIPRGAILIDNSNYFIDTIKQINKVLEKI